MIDFFNKMFSEFLQDTTEWQWWVSQSFALVSMIFAFTAMQQRKRTKILWHRSIYSLLLFIGVCFLGKISAIIMVGIGFFRTLVLLFLAYKTKLSKLIKWLVFAGLAAILITLNIIFWENYLSLLSIAVGLAFLIAFIQEKTINVRRVSIVAALIAIVFYILVLSPANAIINVAVLVSSIIGLFRINRKEKNEQNRKVEGTVHSIN